MAIIIEPLEIRKGDEHTGKYRLTRRSDEEDIGITGMCKHEHDTKEEAINCEEARKCAGLLVQPVKPLMSPEVYAVGMWKCRTCNFVWHRNVLSPTGTCADPRVCTEPCPNDGDVMTPMTWKELSEGNEAFTLQVCEERNALKDELAALKKGRSSIFAHYINEGATLIIDGSAQRAAITVDDDNRDLCSLIIKTWAPLLPEQSEAPLKVHNFSD